MVSQPEKLPLQATITDIEKTDKLDASKYMSFLPDELEVYPQDEITLSLHTLSESYYKYMETVYLQQQQMQNAFLSPANLYTNIQNDIGVFAGFTTCDTTFLLRK